MRECEEHSPGTENPSRWPVSPSAVTISDECITHVCSMKVADRMKGINGASAFHI